MLIVTPELRSRLYRRANGRCECTAGACAYHGSGHRCPHDLGENWTVHHLTTGQDTPETLTAVCQTCHQHTRPRVAPPG